jgi:NAD(P)H dehydrogenase (quinone)
VFMYPVWWSDCPAKLKGWFDRVFSAGFAYGVNGKPREMKLITYGLVLCTAGHPNQLLDEMGISKSMRNIMLDDRLGNRFERKEMVILGGTLKIEDVRQQHTIKIKELAAQIMGLWVA